MRKPRDYDSELKALDDKARRLKERKVMQLGDLVIACGADALTAEQMAGALLTAVGSDKATREGWRERGAAFFLRRSSKSARRPGKEQRGPASDERGTPPT